MLLRIHVHFVPECTVFFLRIFAVVQNAPALSVADREMAEKLKGEGENVTFIVE